MNEKPLQCQRNKDKGILPFGDSRRHTFWREKLPRLNNEETKCPVIQKQNKQTKNYQEIDTIVNMLQKKEKCQGINGFVCELYQIF